MLPGGHKTKTKLQIKPLRTGNIKLIVAANKIGNMELNLAANKIIQFLNSGHKCPADPRSSSGLPSKVKGLPVLPPPLLLLQSTLATLGSIPRPRSQLGESLQQAQCICPHNGYTQRPPGVPDHLAQLPRSCFPTLSPAHSRHS